MPAPKKHARDRVDRRTVSLPAYVVAAAEAAEKKELKPDFSSVMDAALKHYLTIHHPGLLESIRASFPDKPKTSAEADEMHAALDEDRSTRQPRKKR